MQLPFSMQNNINTLPLDQLVKYNGESFVPLNYKTKRSSLSESAALWTSFFYFILKYTNN